jgi:lysophospholipid acyltransferase (LPLAT)-like uncharacterized protein
MDRPFTLKQKIELFLVGILGPLLIYLLAGTWKVEVAGRYDVYPRRKKAPKRIYCFWHNRLLGLAFTERKKNIGILISSHFDGEVIARIVQRMGYRPLRGSSTKGGAAGLLSMLRNEDVWYLAVTVDGPRGPKGIVKPGVIFLAAKSGLEIVPVSCDARRKWVLPSWDNFEIPKPFARVIVSIGDPIRIDDVTGHSQIKEHTETLARTLDRMGQCT